MIGDMISQMEYSRYPTLFNSPRKKEKLDLKVLTGARQTCVSPKLGLSGNGIEARDLWLKKKGNSVKRS